MRSLALAGTSYVTVTVALSSDAHGVAAVVQSCVMALLAVSVAPYIVQNRPPSSCAAASGSETIARMLADPATTSAAFKSCERSAAVCVQFHVASESYALMPPFLVW